MRGQIDCCFDSLKMLHLLNTVIQFYNYPIVADSGQNPSIQEEHQEFLKIILFYVFGRCLVYVPHACPELVESREGLGFPETGVADG